MTSDTIRSDVEARELHEALRLAVDDLGAAAASLRHVNEYDLAEAVEFDRDRARAVLAKAGVES